MHFDRSTYHYQSRRSDPAFLKKRIKEICETHVRYGYRRVYYILRRDGWHVNLKKVYRLYRELGLQLRNKTPKRRVKAKLREDRAPAIRPNDVWAMDFVHDQLATGRKLRILTVVDTFSRLSPVIDPRFSYRGENVVATLDATCRKIGYPKTIRVDSGSGSAAVQSTIYLSGHGSVGLPARCDPRLLPPWQAHRQCVHRSV